MRAADDLLAVRRRGVGGVPQGRNVGGQGPDAAKFLRAQLPGRFAAESVVALADLLLAAQRLLPPPLQRPDDQPVVRVGGSIAPLRQAGLVAGPFQLRLPVGVEAGPLPLDVLGRRQAQLDPGGRQGPQHLLADGRVQDRGGDPGASPGLAGLAARDAVVPRPRAGAVEHPLAVAAMAAVHQPAEQGDALPRVALGCGRRAVLAEPLGVPQVTLPA